MKRSFKLIMGTTMAALVISVAVTSCKKDNITAAPTAALENNTSIPGGLQLMSLVTTCPSGCADRHDTLRSEWVDSALVGIPSSWTSSTRYYNLASGPVASTASYHFTLTGQFISRITAGATLGIYDSTNVPPSDFASIVCSDTTYFSTTGVVGNSLANYRNADTVGWYYYNYMNPFLVNPARVAGIRFSCGYYAIWLQVFVTNRLFLGVRQYRANVVVRTKCLTGC